VAVGEAAGDAAVGDAVAVGVGDAAGLGVGLADRVPDGGVLADWPEAVVPPDALPPVPPDALTPVPPDALPPVPLDALGAPDLESPPPVSA
jgi:hypothetical protein